MTLLSFFHWPRFFRSSTRSKRFSTLRLAAMVLAPFKLRCCDIDFVEKLKELQSYNGKQAAKLGRSPEFFKQTAPI